MTIRLDQISFRRSHSVSHSEYARLDELDVAVWRSPKGRYSLVYRNGRRLDDLDAIDVQALLCDLRARQGNLVLGNDVADAIQAPAKTFNLGSA